MKMIWFWSVIGILGLFFSACSTTQVTRADILNYLESIGKYSTQHPGSDPIDCINNSGGDGLTINDPRVYQLVGIVCDDHATTSQSQNHVEQACFLFEMVSAYYLEQFLPRLKAQTTLIPSSISINYKNSMEVTYEHVKSMFPAVCTKRGSNLVTEACQCLSLITMDHLIDVERHLTDRTGKERVYLAAHCYHAIHGGVNYDEIKELIPNVCDGKIDSKFSAPVMAQIRTGCGVYMKEASSTLAGRVSHLVNYSQAKPLIAHLCKNPSGLHAPSRHMCGVLLKDHMEMLLVVAAGPSGK